MMIYKKGPRDDFANYRAICLHLKIYDIDHTNVRQTNVSNVCY